MDGLTKISLKSSRLALWLHRSVVLLVLLALFSCGLSVLLKSSLILLVLSFAWQQEEFLRVYSIDAIGSEKNQWWIVQADHRIMVERKSDAVVLPWLIVLPLCVVDTHKDCSLVLWPDSLDKEDARRLRVFLRYH